MKRILKIGMSIVLALSVSLPAFAAGVDPAVVNETVPAGGSIEVAKDVTTPSIPLVIDTVLLEDETGSFMDDIGNLQGDDTASDIYDTILAQTPTPDAEFGVTGFRDYGDAFVYQELSSLSPLKQDWLNGIAALTASGGADIPEAQYDAIVAAATSGTLGWRNNAQHVLVVVTDAPFHVPADGPSYINDEASTIAALNAANIVLVGLKAPGAGSELDALAAATGGNVQPLSSDGSDIGNAIIAGLQSLTSDVWWEVISSDPELTVSITPNVIYDVPGNTSVHFTENVTVSADADQCSPDNVFHATVAFYAGDYAAGTSSLIGKESITITVPDTTPPTVSSVESVNPNGNKTPPAGATLPGAKGGVNPDGFYQLIAKDNCDPSPAIYIKDPNFGTVFGPFASGDVIKFTEAPGIDAAQMQKIGSANGQAGAVITHLILSGDPIIYAVDAAGNTSDPDLTQLVPPPPK